VEEWRPIDCDGYGLVFVDLPHKVRHQACPTLVATTPPSHPDHGFEQQVMLVIDPGMETAA
jgi:hypothetical protein